MIHTDYSTYYEPCTGEDCLYCAGGPRRKRNPGNWDQEFGRYYAWLRGVLEGTSERSFLLCMATACLLSLTIAPVAIGLGVYCGIRRLFGKGT